MKRYHLIDAFIDSQLRSAMMPHESYDWTFDASGNAHVTFKGKLTDGQVVNAGYRFFAGQLSLRDEFDSALLKGLTVTIVFVDGKPVVELRKSRNLSNSERNVVLRFAQDFEKDVKERCKRLESQIEQVRTAGLGSMSYASDRELREVAAAISREFEANAV
ncbi:hypothetical protein [Alteromonas gracilis]|uniref:hypothetical protein n=1 Tax=Alteromonas gracilis TaxID=1479524 RepID=UPI0037364CBF